MMIFEIRERLKKLGINDTDCKIACREFLPRLLKDHQIAITLTLKQSFYSMNGKQKVTFYINDVSTELVWERFMRKLNKLVWKSTFINHGRKLNQIAVLEDGSGAKHRHIHAALGNFPLNFDFRTLPRLVKKASEECFEIDRQHKEVISDSGWFEYITKEVKRRDTDNVMW